MVWTRTHGIDNTYGIDSDSWYRIGNSESHTYERAECYPYAGFFSLFFLENVPHKSLGYLQAIPMYFFNDFIVCVFEIW